MKALLEKKKRENKGTLTCGWRCALSTGNR